MKRTFDAIILGAGAAGLFCAATAVARGRRVLVLDHNSQPGRKILISGGGRCNFTHLGANWQHYHSANPRFAASALSAYSAENFLEEVTRASIAWHEKSPGQLFCDHTARQILDLLLERCNRHKNAAELIFDARQIEVQQGSDGSFLVTSSVGEFSAASLVVATGGLSIPKMGATSFGYDLAQQFGMRIVEPRPALVPLTLPRSDEAWKSLSGLSCMVEARIGKTSFRDSMLFTHRGLSGPAILQLSTCWQPGSQIEIDFSPATSKGERMLQPLLGAKARRDAQALRQALRCHFVQRLADHLAEQLDLSAWTNAALEAHEQRLHHWRFSPSGSEGYEKAEVTAGGVDTRDLNAKTLESRSVSGLFFIGEVVDVTGQLGGYNFQWAWSSAWAAAQSL